MGHGGAGEVSVNGTWPGIEAFFSAVLISVPQAPMYYRGANAALLLYDITNAASFEDVRGWLEGEPLIASRLPGTSDGTTLTLPPRQS